ncbi:hypothetical protein ILUMI_01093 [Ignelater luminosus]|uniref:Uncharacterized protein n=1 Tax=Ignelater luminosus TaxID=2038154 RepID=A0A8K0DFZ5_IGNLU|nr:hypothetical protein ILUMI_01093 [Ignelater luminosus]
MKRKASCEEGAIKRLARELRKPKFDILHISEAKPYDISPGRGRFHIKNQDEKGNYEFKYGIVDKYGVAQKGTIENTKEGKEVLRVNGTFLYQPDLDSKVQVEYTADEKGYVARVKQLHTGPDKKNRVPSACITSLQGGCIVGK